jgi:hypothetical protein
VVCAVETPWMASGNRTADPLFFSSSILGDDVYICTEWSSS